MGNDARNVKDKENYEAPKVLASYSKKELEEAIQPHGPYNDNGCGSIL